MTDRLRGILQVFLIVVMTFVAINLATVALVMSLSIIERQWGRIPPGLDDSVAFELYVKEPHILLVSIFAASSVMAIMALLSSLSGEHEDRWTALARWWGLRRVRGTTLLWAWFGIWGVGLFLDGSIRALGLQDYGALAEMKATLSGLSWPVRVGASLVIGLLPGFAEEMFFRGYVLRRLMTGLGPLGAWMVSSALFGLFHADWVHSPTAFGLGLYIGLVVLMTGSLWTGIFVHVLNNVVATLAAGTGFEPGASLSATSGMLLGSGATVVALVVLSRRYENPFAEISEAKAAPDHLG